MNEQHSPPDSFWAGFRTTMPLWFGTVPFGAVYAVTALAAGLTPAQTLAMSLLVFAGASQFTAAGLIAAGAAPLSIILTTLIVNARHLLLTTSLVPHLRGVPAGWRTLLAAHLTDESYAVGMRAFLAGGGGRWFQFGANSSLYVSWQASTLLGILLGTQIPDPAAYGLDLVFPLTFIALLVPLLRDRFSVATAALAAVLALAGAVYLPGRWYVLLAGIVASGIGALLSRAQVPARTERSMS